MRCGPSIAAACIALGLLAGGAANAHEIGTTRVAAFFGDGRYDIEIVTDAAALTEKLKAAAGGTVALDDVFRQRIAVVFDGVEDHPAIQYAGASTVATIRLSGDIPRDARYFTWKYSWTFASYALSIRKAEAGSPATEWLDGGQSSTPLPLTGVQPAVSRAATAWRYLTLGFTHIVPHGLDHVLFVLGIFLLSRRLKTVLWQVSAFTVAHSLTLGLSMYGVIAAPPTIVEPLIAVSIAYVAIENLLLTDLKVWRIALVFAFGLLHGLGFAGALRELGLPRSEFVTALVTFNVGVEGGQLAVIAAAFALVGWQWHNAAAYRRRIVIPASMLIACMAVYWTVERVATFYRIS